jgi:hypothetical protein
MVAATHSWRLKKFLYHCSDQPLGGNSRYWDALNDNGKITTTGKIRNTNTAPTMDHTKMVQPKGRRNSRSIKFTAQV